MHITWLYFFVLVIIGAYFAVNLFLAVLTSLFTAHEGLVKDEEIQQEKQVKIHAVVELMKRGTERPEALPSLKSRRRIRRGGVGNDTDSSGNKQKLMQTVRYRDRVSVASSSGSDDEETSNPENVISAVSGKTADTGQGNSTSFLPYSVVLRNKGALILRSARSSPAYNNLLSASLSHGGLASSLSMSRNSNRSIRSIRSSRSQNSNPSHLNSLRRGFSSSQKQLNNSQKERFERMSRRKRNTNLIDDLPTPRMIQIPNCEMMTECTSSSSSSDDDEYGPFMQRRGCLIGVKKKSFQSMQVESRDDTLLRPHSPPYGIPNDNVLLAKMRSTAGEQLSTVRNEVINCIEEAVSTKSNSDEDSLLSGLDEYEGSDASDDHPTNLATGTLGGFKPRRAYHWDKKYDVLCFSAQSCSFSMPCAEVADIRKCKKVCIDQELTAFAIINGVAYFSNKKPEKMRPSFKQEAGVTLYLLSRWWVFKNHDAYHGHDIETTPFYSIAVCRRYCLDKGYGGFAKKGNLVYFRVQSSTECAELIAEREGITFHLPNTEINELLNSGCRKKMRELVLHPTFELFMLVLTILNVAALAVDHAGIDDDMVLAIEIMNTICTVFFTIEITMKFVGLGILLTLKDNYNKIDAILVAIGLPQTIIYWSYSKNGGSGVASIFRLLRVARVLRLGRRWNLLRKTIQIVVGSLVSVGYLSLVLLLIVFIYAVMGMQLFGMETTPPDERLDFGTLWSSLLTVFVVITGEGWSRVMAVTMQQTTWVSSLYFISLFVVGRYIILNLFIAIIIDNFHKDREAALLNVTDKEAMALMEKKRIQNLEMQEAANHLVADAIKKEETHPDRDTDDEATEDDPTIHSPRSEKGLLSPRAQDRNTSVIDLKFRDQKRKKAASPHQSINVSQDSDVSEEESSGIAVVDVEFFGPNTCNLFSVNSPVRTFLTPIVTSRIFDFFIVCVIVVNLSLLAMESPSTSHLHHLFFWTDVVVTVIFVVEMLAKIVVFGIYETEYAYLKDLWNDVDGFVTVTSILGLFIPFFTLFRSFRVFRLATRSQNVKVVLYAAVGAIPSVLNGLVICGFSFTLFGIMGVQLFKGIMVDCTDPTYVTRHNCTAAGEHWTSLTHNYDNFFHAIFTLLKIGLSEEWVSIMFSTVDAVGEDEGPSRGYNEWVVLYYISFIVLASFLGLNLIISILISSFSSYHEARFVQIAEIEENQVPFSGWKQDKQRFKSIHHKLLTEGQRKWVRSQQLLVGDNMTFIPSPKQSWRNTFYKVVESDVFEKVVAAVILLNLLLLCTQHADESEKYQEFFKVINYHFVGFYILEAVVKMFAHTVPGYFSDHWNRFDFFVLVISIAGLIVDTSLTVFRVLRIARVLRLFHMSKGLNKMFSALIYALPPLFNIALLLTCVFFVFGVVGVELFGELDLGLNPYLSHNINFRNLGEAFLALFQVSTGELWIHVMQGCRVSAPYCNMPDCGTEWAILYFVLFMIIVSFLMVNLFVAVVIEAFQDADQVLSNDELVQAFKSFRRSWLQVTFFTPTSNDEMNVYSFLTLLSNTPPPLGIQGQSGGAWLRLLRDLNIPVSRDMTIHYADVVHALARHVYAINLDQAFELSHLSVVKLTDDSFTVAHVWCVRKILSTWKRHIKTRKALREAEAELPSEIEEEESPDGAQGSFLRSPQSQKVFKPFTAVEVRDTTGGITSNPEGQKSFHSPLHLTHMSPHNRSAKSVVPWDRLAQSGKPPTTPLKRPSNLQFNSPGGRSSFDAALDD
eukprot:TRINITY_DN490_c1_g2_i1.p1 TRINITY_DN490_c1_g2~~TRINITY_DN490_c1_g2_i1.p1  ORF type:complete len:1817 (+),score=331.83 TRINITY_DN490_c1_g2_i1:181-5451(+)